MLVHSLVIVGSYPCGLLVTVILLGDRYQTGIVGYVLVVTFKLCTCSHLQTTNFHIFSHILVSPATNCGYTRTLPVYCITLSVRMRIFDVFGQVYRYLLYVEMLLSFVLYVQY